MRLETPIFTRLLHPFVLRLLSCLAVLGASSSSLLITDCGGSSDCATNTASYSIGAGFGKDGSGNLYNVGYGVDADGLWHFLTRESSDDGATWSTIDDFDYVGGKFGQALGFTVDTSGNLYTAGYATDFLNSAHFITRESSGSGTAWITADDFVYSGGVYSLARATGVDLAGNIYTVGVGHDASATSHWIVRESTTHGATWITVDDFIYSGGTNSEAYGFAVDLAGNVYVAGYGTDATNVSHYVVRMSANNGTTWSTSDDFVYTGGNLSLAKNIGVDAAGNIYSVGVGEDAAFKSHYIVRQSLNHGGAWSTVDDYFYPSGGSQASANAIVADASGNIYSTGFATDSTNVSHFITRLSINAGGVWNTVDDFTYATGSEQNVSNAIGLDATNNVFAVGTSTDSSAETHFITRKSVNHGGAWTTALDFFYIAPYCP